MAVVLSQTVGKTNQTCRIDSYGQYHYGSCRCSCTTRGKGSQTFIGMAYIFMAYIDGLCSCSLTTRGGKGPDVHAVTHHHVVRQWTDAVNSCEISHDATGAN